MNKLRQLKCIPCGSVRLIKKLIFYWMHILQSIEFASDSCEKVASLKSMALFRHKSPFYAYDLYSEKLTQYKVNTSFFCALNPPL